MGLHEPNSCPEKNHAVSGGGLVEHGWGQVRGGDESAHCGRSCWKERTLGSWCRGRRNAASTYGGGRTRCHSAKEGWTRGTLAIGIAEDYLADRARGGCRGTYQVTGVNRAFAQVLGASVEGAFLALAVPQ